MNFKVKCIESNRPYCTVGKVYEIKDNIFTDDEGFRYVTWSLFGSGVDNLNKFFAGFVVFEPYEKKNVTSKEDLRTGDVVKYRNGEVGIVFTEIGSILFRDDSYEELDYFKDDLTCSESDYNKYDIVAVRRPTKTYECRFRAFDKELGTLVYEREEPVEEMTIEEVCKALGKDVKIVESK